MRNLGAVAFCFGLFCSSGQAFGQVTNDTKDLVIPGVDVALRQHPEYDPQLLDVGSFWLIPNINVAANYNDNILAQDINKQGDAFLTIAPDLQIISNWSRDKLILDLFARRDVYARLTNENASTIGLKGNGNWDFAADTNVKMTFLAEKLPEVLSQLGSFRGAGKPVNYTELNGTLELNHQLGDLDLHLDTAATRYAYSSIKIGQTLYDQRYRNTTVFKTQATALYSITPQTSIGVTVSYVKANYDLRPGQSDLMAGMELDRRYQEYRIDGVVRIQPTDLFSGTLELGYFHRHYDDSTLISPSGLDIRMDLLYNITPLTSITLHADRTNFEYAELNYVGTTQYSERLQINHELFRPLLLTFLISHDTYKANGPGFPGVEWMSQLTARYLVNRAITVFGTLGISQRTSEAIAVVYHSKSANINLRYTF
jgi:hypothetical protein